MLLTAAILTGTIVATPWRSETGELTVDLGRSAGVTFVGAIDRWDADGNPRMPVNPMAKIDAPDVTATARMVDGNRWVFAELPSGRYDLVILTSNRIRVEGFYFPAVSEFDVAIDPTVTAPSDARKSVLADLAKSKHYENKVTPLSVAGSNKQVRVLMQLLRDQPTSYDAEFGAPVATLRHEVWQYSNRSGGWAKDKKTRILDRILMAKADLARWTWVWEPQLGGIEIVQKSARLTYEIPDRLEPEKCRGLFTGLQPSGPP